MTPELHKELIVDIVSVTLTAVFTGIPAGLLLWWTWQRDQERLVVQKLLTRVETITGDKVLANDNFGPEFGILIRNRSLFPVHISATGFQIDGKVIALEHPRVPLKMKRNPDARSPYLNIPDDSADPWEIPSQSSQRISLNDVDRIKIVTAILNASEKYGVSVEDLLRSHRVAALAATETGKEFNSVPVLARVRDLFAKILLPPMDCH
jgi:hypothetical protein